MRALKILGTAAFVAIPVVVLWVVYPLGLLFLGVIFTILVLAALHLERRRQAQRSPRDVTKDVLNRVNREFGESDRRAVIEILEEFAPAGRKPTFQAAEPAGLWRTFVRWLDDRGKARIHHAILKLSRGNADDVRFYLQHANSDWRDVLAWAEYGHDPPRRSSSGPPDFSKLSSGGSVSQETPS